MENVEKEEMHAHITIRKGGKVGTNNKGKDEERVDPDFHIFQDMVESCFCQDKVERLKRICRI
jgi:hypothetical protein